MSNIPEAAHGGGRSTERCLVLGVPISAVSWDRALSQVVAWGRARESRYVCICNVHSVITATQDDDFRRAIEQSDLATPDGAPVAWTMRLSGVSGQQRINGPDLMARYLAFANEQGGKIFLLGSTDAVLRTLSAEIARRYPGVSIVGALSPPFRALSADENQAIVDQINLSGAETVWVSLGCPKQELWMYENRGRANCVMLGVGAAFEYLAGTRRRAPKWMQACGLEWAFRLMAEPRRLWRRYAVTNSLFLLRVAQSVLRRQRGHSH